MTTSIYEFKIAINSYFCILWPSMLNTWAKSSICELRGKHLNMASFDRDTIKKLTKLSRIQCNEEEEPQLISDLQKILSYVELMNEVDTENVKPCNHVLEEVCNVERDDVVGEIMPREVFLANAPDKIGGMIRVPPIMKSSN